MLFKKSTYNCWLLHNQNDFCIVCWLPDDIVQKSGAKIIGFFLITNYFDKRIVQSQACLSSAIARNSLTLVNYFDKRIVQSQA